VRFLTALTIVQIPKAALGQDITVGLRCSAAGEVPEERCGRVAVEGLHGEVDDCCTQLCALAVNSLDEERGNVDRLAGGDESRTLDNHHIGAAVYEEFIAIGWQLGLGVVGEVGFAW